jgi:hypothetical protein
MSLYSDRNYFIMLLNRNVLGLVVSDTSIPEVIKEPDTTLSSEDGSKSSKSKLLWSLAGVFIIILICCCGFGMVGLKQMSDSKAGQSVVFANEGAQVRSQNSMIEDREYLILSHSTRASAETGVPLVAAYQTFNQDETLSSIPHAHAIIADPTEQCSISSRLTLVSIGSSLSMGSDAFNVEVPPGTLGLELIHSDAEWPVIQAVKRPSIASGIVQAGDRLAFIDGKDVRSINPDDLARMMNAACDQSRRLTVLRAPANNETETD